LSVKDCEACIAEGDAEKLLQLITNDKGAMQAFVSMENAEDATSCFAIITALVVKTGTEQSMVQKLAGAVVGVPNSSQATVARKLCLLSVLYNMQSEKIDTLTQMFVAAGSYPDVFLTDESALGALLVAQDTGMPMAPAVPRLVSYLDKWQVSLKEKRKLLEAIASVLPDSRKQLFLLLLVESYNGSSGGDGIVDATGRQAALQVAVGAIQDPIKLFRQQRNILALPAVQTLQQDQSALWKLLKIFQEGKLSDFQSYLKQNGGAATLTQWGLDADACEKHMKVLSLCSLAAEHEEIPYQVIADTLAITPDKVESQVILAVNSGLLEAKMDQLTQKVMVERCVVRKFDIEEWKGLQKRLQTWKDNVGSILEALKQSEAATTAVP
jgi:translation initiation factor 3 subunit M